MINDFKPFVKYSKGLMNLSGQQASDLIDRYNIYFTTHIVATSFDRLDYDLPIDFMVYQLDNLKSFDTQYAKIKTINFPDSSRISFFTDYKQNQDVIFKRISEANQILAFRNKKVSVSALVAKSKVSKEVVSKYLESQEKYKTKSLFD